MDMKCRRYQKGFAHPKIPSLCVRFNFFLLFFSHFLSQSSLSLSLFPNLSFLISLSLPLSFSQSLLSHFPFLNLLLFLSLSHPHLHPHSLILFHLYLPLPSSPPPRTSPVSSENQIVGGNLISVRRWR